MITHESAVESELSTLTEQMASIEGKLDQLIEILGETMAPRLDTLVDLTEDAKASLDSIESNVASLEIIARFPVSTE